MTLQESADLQRQIDELRARLDSLEQKKSEPSSNINEVKESADVVADVVGAGPVASFGGKVPLVGIVMEDPVLGRLMAAMATSNLIRNLLSILVRVI